MGVLNIITDGATRILELNRPEKRNALNAELVTTLKSALQATDGDGTLRCVVIRGAGKDFCSGADLASLQEISENTFEENVADAMELAGLFWLIREIRLPVIAAVHGRALAGGCGLATACDLVVASTDARFGYPEVKIGFVPAMVASILRRSLGEKKSFELLTQGFEFSADEALALGLVNRVFDETGFAETVVDYAGVYSAVSGSAVDLTKKLLYRIDNMDIGSALEEGAEVNARARATDDCKRGIARFLEK